MRFLDHIKIRVKIVAVAVFLILIVLAVGLGEYFTIKAAVNSGLAATQNTIQTAFWIMLAGVLAALIIGLALALLVAQSILKPVRIFAGSLGDRKSVV